MIGLSNNYSLIIDELLKLHAEGLEVFVDKNTMEKDKVLHPRKCFSAFVKNDRPLSHKLTKIFSNLYVILTVMQSYMRPIMTRLWNLR